MESLVGLKIQDSDFEIHIFIIIAQSGVCGFGGGMLN